MRVDHHRFPSVSVGMRQRVTCNLMKKRWIDKPAEEEQVRSVAVATGMPEPLARALCTRGFHDAALANAFLNPRLSELGDPFFLPDMAEAVDLLWEAIEQDQHICIHGDYDMDGICSTALVYEVLRSLHAHVRTFLPHRIDDGYGLTVDTVKQCMDDGPLDLLITVDCGTGSVDATAYAIGKGVRVIVTDHHEVSEEGIADADALVNPKVSDVPNYEYLAGVGVAFKLCHALLKEGRQRGKKTALSIDLKRILDLAAMGTVADVVPLLGDNRLLVKYGLQACSESRRKGLIALMAVAGVKHEVKPYHVGFQLAPRINAAGRLDRPAKALDLLLTDSDEEARSLAEELNVLNKERQDVEKRTVKEAEIQVQNVSDTYPFGIVVAAEGWHPGVIGIVASRLQKKQYRPAVVIALNQDGRGKGSCRSIKGYSLIDGLTACSDLLIKFGGHKMAAGLEIEADKIEAFRVRFNEHIEASLCPADLVPPVEIDAWLNSAHLDELFYEQMMKLSPFGEGNREPIWAMHGCRVMKKSIVGQGHLKMILSVGSGSIDAIGFGMADAEIPDGPIDAAFRLTKNSYMNRETLQMQLLDIRAQGEPQA